jgi:hypothetical protein
MALVTAISAHNQRRSIDRRARAIAFRCAGALAAAVGLAAVLWLGVAPLRVTVHDRAPVSERIGEQGTGLILTDQTQAETRHVTCVPALQYDNSANQDPVCPSKVSTRLGLAPFALALFFLGSAVWIVSGGDRYLGLSGRREYVVSRL